MWFRAFLMQKESQWPQNGFGGAHKLSSHLSTPMSQSAPDRISYLSSISSLSSSHSGLFAVPSIGEGCLFLGIFLLAIFQAATFFPMVCTSDSLLFQLFVQILTRSSLTILVKMELPPPHTHTTSKHSLAHFLLHCSPQDLSPSNSTIFHLYILLAVYNTHTHTHTHTQNRYIRIQAQ